MTHGQPRDLVYSRFKILSRKLWQLTITSRGNRDHRLISHHNVNINAQAFVKIIFAVVEN